MKIKTSITLSEKIIKCEDFNILNKNADELNKEAEDVLSYQLDLFNKPFYWLTIY